MDTDIGYKRNLARELCAFDSPKTEREIPIGTLRGQRFRHTVMSVPDSFAGRWQTAVVLKRDVFSTVERGTLRTERGDLPGVLRRLDDVPWWSRPIARHLFDRERRALTAAAPLDVAPRLLYADDRRLVRGYIPGSAMKIARPHGDHAYFRSARSALRTLHRAGICHNDLAKEQNWLRSPDGRAYLLDFQLAVVFRHRNRLFRLAAYEDLRHLLKHKQRYVPDAVTPAEHRVLARKALPTRIWMMTGKKLYLLVTRGLLGFMDSEGGGARLSRDAPAIEAALQALPSVRDAVVVDFPARNGGTGLYAFVEADAPLTEADLRDRLAAAAGAEPLPEFIQVCDVLPRRADGVVRRDILRLIATDQIDLIAPLAGSEPERRVAERLAASRRNLSGAPEIAAALMSYPGVGEAAVVTYPDRLAGVGLYAFVEAASGPSADGETRRPPPQSPGPEPSGLAAHVGGMVGREHVPTYIQVVPALPRNPAGQVRADILQRIAANQVDDIDALITSEAERAAVVPILAGRLNFKDRFVL